MTVEVTLGPMELLLAAWIACVTLGLWAFFVAGRLKSVKASVLALGLGLAPLFVLTVSALPWPVLDRTGVAVLGAASLGLTGAWGVAVWWARHPPSVPWVDAARMRWVPRASHRPTWVIAAGLVTLLTLALGIVGRPAVALLPWAAWILAHRWAHTGDRGVIRVESRDVLLAGQRIPMVELSDVHREVQFLGPVRRERLVVTIGDRRFHWLVTGSLNEDVAAVQHLLRQQVDFARDHLLDRGPELAPPAWLADVDQLRRRPVPAGPDGKAT